MENTLRRIFGSDISKQNIVIYSVILMKSIKQQYNKLINDVFNKCRNYTVFGKKQLTENYIKQSILEHTLVDNDTLNSLYDIILASLQKSIRKLIRKQTNESGIQYNEDIMELYGPLIVDDKFFDLLYEKSDLQQQKLQKDIDDYFAKYPEAKDYFEMYTEQSYYDEWFVVKLLTCPYCNSRFECSEYLSKVFKNNPKIEWLANMVTHYRHDHLTSWNKCWGRYGNYYRGHWFKDYDEEKRKVNERQKRQILRQCKQFLLDHHFTVDDFKQLSETSEETIKLAEKILKYE